MMPGGLATAVMAVVCGRLLNGEDAAGRRTHT